MAITLTTTSQDPQVLIDAFAAHGATPVVAPREEGNPAEPAKATGDTPGEGDKHSENDPTKGVKPEDETKKEAPKGEEPKVEAKVDGQPEADKPKSKGGFQAKVEKLTAERERLRDDLEAERGSKAKLQAQLDEVNAKLAEMKPAPKDEAKKDEGPVRPKRPTREEFEYDEEKFEAAEAEYDTKLDAYYAEVADRKAEARVAAAEAARTEKAKADEFAARMKKGAEGIADYDELLAEMPDGYEGLVGKSRVANDYMLLKAKNPAALVHFLMKDYLENDEAETDRLLALDPFDLVIELRAIEDRLAKAPASVKEIDDTKPKTEKPEAKEQPKPKQANPEAPITPLGGRHQPNSMDLEEQARAAAMAGDAKLYRQIRAQQRAAKQPARVA